MIGRNNGIADVNIAHLPDNGAQIAHFSGAQFFGGDQAGSKITHLIHFKGLAGRFDRDFIAFGQAAGKNPDMRNNPAVRIIIRIEDQASQGRCSIRLSEAGCG